MQTFRLHTSSHSTSALEKALEVKLISTTSYEDAQYNGTFKHKKNQNEVYIRITGTEDLYTVCNEEDFLHKLLLFCDKFQ